MKTNNDRYTLGEYIRTFFHVSTMGCSLVLFGVVGFFVLIFGADYAIFKGERNKISNAEKQYVNQNYIASYEKIKEGNRQYFDAEKWRNFEKYAYYAGIDYEKEDEHAKAFERFIDAYHYKDTDELIIRSAYLAGLEAHSEGDYLTALGYFKYCPAVEEAAPYIVDSLDKYMSSISGKYSAMSLDASETAIRFLKAGAPGSGEIYDKWFRYLPVATVYASKSHDGETVDTVFHEGDTIYFIIECTYPGGNEEGQLYASLGIDCYHYFHQSYWAEKYKDHLQFIYANNSRHFTKDVIWFKDYELKNPDYDILTMDVVRNGITCDEAIVYIYPKE